MRLRHAALAIAALTLLGVTACGDDPDDAAPAAPVSSVPAGLSAPGTPRPSAAVGTSADPGTPPTEGTATAKPPSKGGEAAQGPAGKPTSTP